MSNKKKASIVLIFFIIVMIEFFSFLVSKFNLLSINDTPHIYLKNPKQNISNYWNEKEIWGAWHEKNFKVKHTKKCFDVEYNTNEIGARDDSFLESNNNNNIILLGDSFAEGYGVEKDNMFEKKIEKLTKRKILNFSSSKDFGFIQYLLIYQHLAKNFNHDTIIISFLPNNDFKDNDLIYYKDNKLDFINGKNRHRPYYIKKNNTYEILYPKHNENNYKNLIEFSKKYFWTSNVLRTIKYLFVSYKLNKAKQKSLVNNFSKKETEHITDYYFTPQYQQEAIIFFLKKFIKENSNKNILLFSIPLYEDYEIIKKNDYRKNIYWWKKMKNFDLKNKNFYFLDLYDYVPKKYDDYFFSDKCDGHWNSKGHKWSGEIIAKYLLELDVQ